MLPRSDGSAGANRLSAKQGEGARWERTQLQLLPRGEGGRWATAGIPEGPASVFRSGEH